MWAAPGGALRCESAKTRASARPFRAVLDEASTKATRGSRTRGLREPRPRGAWRRKVRRRLRLPTPRGPACHRYHYMHLHEPRASPNLESDAAEFDGARGVCAEESSVPRAWWKRARPTSRMPSSAHHSHSPLSTHHVIATPPRAVVEGDVSLASAAPCSHQRSPARPRARAAASRAGRKLRSKPGDDHGRSTVASAGRRWRGSWVRGGRGRC